MSFKQEVLDSLHALRLLISRLGDEIMIDRQVRASQIEKSKLLSGVPLSEAFGDMYKRVDENLVECEVCGCLLKKETARKGESTIKQQMRPSDSQPWQDEDKWHPYVSKKGWQKKEVIVEHYFCKLCYEVDDEEQVETGTDCFTCDPCVECVPTPNCPDEQLKRAQRDYFLGQAELLRAQAESVKVDTKAKKGGS